MTDWITDACAILLHIILTGEDGRDSNVMYVSILLFSSLLAPYIIS